MARRGPQQICFICVGISETAELISKEILASSQEEASSLFKTQNGTDVKNIHGPYFKKKTQVLDTTRSLKFSKEFKQAEFNGWFVKAMLLTEPANHAFLIFINRVDGNKISKPKGTYIVPISNLRIMNNG